MSDYSKWGKKYYMDHREEILTSEKEKKRWLDYYARNKEVISERNRARYYEKRGLPVPPKGSKAATTAAARAERKAKPVVDKELVERFEKLVGELRDLAPHVVKKGRPSKPSASLKAEVPGEVPGAGIDAPASTLEMVVV